MGSFICVTIRDPNLFHHDVELSLSNGQRRRLNRHSSCSTTTTRIMMMMTRMKTATWFCMVLLWSAQAFVPKQQQQQANPPTYRLALPMTDARGRSTTTTSLLLLLHGEANHQEEDDIPTNRRRLLQNLAVVVGSTTAASLVGSNPAQAEEPAAEGENMFGPKFVQTYSDFVQMDDGTWSYRDVTPGKSGTTAAQVGDRVVRDSFETNQKKRRWMRDARPEYIYFRGSPSPTPLDPDV